MANTIKLKIQVDDDGNLKLVGKNAEKAAKGLEKTGKSARTADRNLKGAAQASANSTKNFSKLAQGIGGKLVPAYATLAANIFAVTAAFNAFQRAAQIEQLEDSLIRTGNVAGQNLIKISDGLKAITGNAIDTEQALRTVATGTAQGFSGAQLEDLTRIAKGASIALGRDLGDALDRLVRGTAKLEPEILDELGIIVRLDDAAQEYAQSIGKTARQLTQFEKQQAFANAVTEQGLKKFGDVQKFAEANPYDKLAASFFDLKKGLFELINTGLAPVVEFLSDKPLGLFGVISIFASTIINQLTPALSELAVTSREKFTELSRQASIAAKKIQTQFSKELSKLKSLDFAPKGFKELEPLIKSNKARVDDYSKALSSLNKSEKVRARNIVKYKEQLKGLRGAERAAHKKLMEEKELELAAIREQIRATERLKAVVKSGQNIVGKGGAQAAANNAKRAANIGRREATATNMMQNAGVFGQFAIAGKASKNMTKEVGKATGALGKLGVASKVAGASVRLFGTAILNAIPVIGQLLFFATLAWETLTGLFGNPFEATAVEKAAEEAIESAEKMTKAFVDVRAAIADASTDGEKFFIGLKAGTGFIEQTADGLRGLSNAAKKETEETVLEYRKSIDEVGGFWDTFASAFTGEKGQAIRSLREELGNERFSQEMIEKRVKELREAQFDRVREASTIVNRDDVANTVTGYVQALESAAFVDTKSVNLLNEFKNEILAEDYVLTTDKLDAFIKKLEESQKPAERFINSLQELDQSASQFSTEFNKLTQKSNTPFSGLLSAAQQIKNVFDNVKETSKEVGAGGEQVGQILEKLGPSAKKLAAQLMATEGYKQRAKEVGEAEALAEAFDTVFNNIEATDNKFRDLNSEIKKSKTLQRELGQFSKVSLASATALQTEKANELELQKLLNTEQIKLFRGRADDADAQRKANQLDKENEAIAAQIKAIQDDKVTLLQAEFNEKKRVLGIENKILGVKREEQRIELENLSTRQRSEERVAKRGFAFEFIDQGNLKIDQDIEKNQTILETLKGDTQKKIDASKKALISAEYKLLSAQLNAQARIERAKANDKNNNLSETDRENLRTSAIELEEVSSRIIASEQDALDAVDKATNARIAGVTETLAALAQAKEDLEPINQLIQTIDDSLTSNLTSAFDALITGTKSAKDAFADMAKAILSDIAAMIAKQLVLNLLIAATGGQGGFFSNLFGREGGIFEGAPSKRYGGMTEPQTFGMGGIARGREAGYPAILHGTEAVVPLPNGKEIPVKMMGGGQSNNVVVNVNVDSNGNAQQNTEGDQGGMNLGNAIAAAVQKELQNQKRSGGILNPYGAA